MRQLSNPRTPERHQDIALPRTVSRPPTVPANVAPDNPRFRLTDDEVDRVVAGYQAGLTLAELATAFGADRRTLAGWLHQRGVSRRGRRFTATDVDELIRLYRDGWSLAQIGSHFGVYPQTIRYHLQKARIELRPRPGWTPKPT